MLLQVDVSVGLELILVYILITFVIVYFTYRDAAKRPGVNEILWTAVMGLSWLLLTPAGFIIVFAVYYFLVVRD